jgi:hypothetical protein
MEAIMFKLPRYIPKDSTPIERAGLPAIVYSYTGNSGRPAAVAYIGKSSKHAWHYHFLNEARRQEKIDMFFNGIAQREDFKLTRKVERVSFDHSLKVGDVLYSSWGYDQTNVEFFQITATTQKTVTFREICQSRGRDGTLSDSGTCAPIKNMWTNDSKPYTRTVRPGNSVSFAEYEGGYTKYLSLLDRPSVGWSDGH